VRRLFLKIFLWYWLATSIMGLVLFIAIWSTSDRQGPLWLRDVGNLLEIHGAAAVDAFERDGRQGLAAYLDRTEPDESMRTYVFDDSGAEVSGRIPPPPVVEMAATARNTTRAEFGLGMPSMVVAQPIVTPGGRTFVVAAQFSGGRRGPPLTTGPMVARALAVLAAAGIVCYGLAWYLTRRIERLRVATRALARGDLAIRVGETLGSGRDELSELGRDVDEMAGRLEALLASERRLLQDVSHELRSPLARLVVALELLRQRSDVAASPEFDRIELEASRLDDLIGRILTLTRLESLTAASEHESTVDLAGLVSDVAADAEFEAAAANRRVEIVANDPCVVRGDETLLRSAIENVIRNAIRYTGEETAVEVSLRVQSASAPASRLAVVSVRDHGPGVPDDALDHLFRPFYRVDDGRARQSGGTGLGLAIAERAVRLHGGSATAGNAPDGGLVIELSIPAEKES
jgi:two-component system sensor histidine kinase CpxA